MQYLSVYCTLSLHHVIECTPKRSELSVQYRTHRCKQMLECCRQDTKEAIICIDNKYALIKFNNLYQINHNISYFSTKISHLTGSILNWGAVRLSIVHILTRDAVSSFYVRFLNKLDSKLVLINRKMFELYNKGVIELILVNIGTSWL